MKFRMGSSLGRAIDVRYPTNRAIVIISAAVLLLGSAGSVLAGASLLDSVLWGFSASVATFLGWALGRELDPDYELSAFLAGLLALAAIIWLGSASLLGALWAILLLRTVNRTVGAPPTSLDVVAIVTLTGIMGYTEGWVIPALAVIVFTLNAVLPPPSRRALGIAASVLVLAIVLFVLEPGKASELAWTMGPVLAALVSGILTLLMIVTSGSIRSLADQTSERCSPLRVRTAQGLALGLVLAHLTWRGPQSFQFFSPLWAALIGVGIYRLFVVLPRSFLRE